MSELIDESRPRVRPAEESGRRARGLDGFACGCTARGPRIVRRPSCKFAANCRGRPEHTSSSKGGLCCGTIVVQVFTHTHCIKGPVAEVVKEPNRNSPSPIIPRVSSFVPKSPFAVTTQTGSSVIPGRLIGHGCSRRHHIHSLASGAACRPRSKDSEPVPSTSHRRTPR